MPHFDPDGKIYDRVTEIIGVIECEEKGYHTRTINDELRKGKRSSWDVMVTFDTIKGTLVHHEIQKFIHELMDLPEPVPRWSPEEEQMIFQIENNPDLKKELDRKVARAYENFIDFWSYYNPIPLACEETVKKRMEFTGKDGRKHVRDVKGNIDLVCLIEEGKLDETKRRTPRSDDLRVIILDWKSGTRHMTTHKTQISFYYVIASDELLPRFLKRYDYYTWNDRPEGIDVYLGGNTYKVKQFPINQRLFFSTVTKYNEAERIPLNTLSGDVAKTLMQCVYCNHRNRCSVFVEMRINVPEDFADKQTEDLEDLPVKPRQRLLR